MEDVLKRSGRVVTLLILARGDLESTTTCTTPDRYSDFRGPTRYTTDCIGTIYDMVIQLLRLVSALRQIPME